MPPTPPATGLLRREVAAVGEPERLWSRVRTAAARWRRSLAGDDDTDPELRSAYVLAIALTLIPLALGRFRAPTLLSALAIAGLAVPAIARDVRYWLVAFVLVVQSPLERPWLALDNHDWLHVYWLAALTVTRLASQPARALRSSARLLIGFAFLFATAWKLFTPEFVTGGFFQFMFSVDSRLGDVAAAVNWQEAGATRDNRLALAAWRDPASELGPVAITVAATVARVAPLLAWATVLLEGAVAASFLAPLRGRWHVLRDVTLLTFVVTTYPLAPVIGFGLLLLAMGAMQSELRPGWRSTLYVTAFVGVGLLAERASVLAWLERILGGT
jgi:hypothetical protein